MIVKSISLQQFRNHAQSQAEFHDGINIIIGENAQGKTNLLEAIYYCSSAKSFRSMRGDKELIGFGAPYCELSAVIESQAREYVVAATLQAGVRRKMSINGVKLEHREELSRILRCVLFSPEDLSLVRAGALERRRFLDQSLSQMRPRYDKAISEYQKLYDHKLRILRDWEDKPSLLDVLDDFSTKMAYYGAIIIHYRARLIARLSPHAAQVSSDCSNGKDALSLHYETVSTVRDPEGDLQQIAEDLLTHYQTHRELELHTRSCLSGPHKDDLLVRINGIDARKFASQGQARTTALALKLAEREIHFEETGEYPVLLLDDVLSELDDARQSYVRERIRDGQVFITCCSEEQLIEQANAKLIRIHEGAVISES